MLRSIIHRGRRLEYTLIQTVRQSVLFKALPGGEIRVYAPKFLHLRDIDAMVAARADELLRMGQAVDRRVQEVRRNHPVGDGAMLMIEGEPHVIKLSKGPRVSGVVAPGELRLSLPHPEEDPAVRGAIRAVLSQRALERIRQRVEFYAPQIGRRPGRITVRDQKTRWGSCSQKGNLNFNWKLIMAPPQVLDYVVIHELCHLWEFNHSPRFWSLVEGQMPDYEVWKKWLKAHREEMEL